MAATRPLLCILLIGCALGGLLNAEIIKQTDDKGSSNKVEETNSKLLQVYNSITYIDKICNCVHRCFEDLQNVLPADKIKEIYSAHLSSYMNIIYSAIKVDPTKKEDALSYLNKSIETTQFINGTSSALELCPNSVDQNEKKISARAITKICSCTVNCFRNFTSALSDHMHAHIYISRQLGSFIKDLTRRVQSLGFTITEISIQGREHVADSRAERSEEIKQEDSVPSSNKDEVNEQEHVAETRAVESEDKQEDSVPSSNKDEVKEQEHVAKSRAVESEEKQEDSVPSTNKDEVKEGLLNAEIIKQKDDKGSSNKVEETNSKLLQVYNTKYIDTICNRVHHCFKDLQNVLPADKIKEIYSDELYKYMNIIYSTITLNSTKKKDALSHVQNSIKATQFNNSTSSTVQYENGEMIFKIGACVRVCFMDLIANISDYGDKENNITQGLSDFIRTVITRLKTTPTSGFPSTGFPIQGQEHVAKTRAEKCEDKQEDSVPSSNRDEVKEQEHGVETRVVKSGDKQEGSVPSSNKDEVKEEKHVAKTPANKRQDIKQEDSRTSSKNDEVKPKRSRNTDPRPSAGSSGRTTQAHGSHRELKKTRPENSEEMDKQRVSCWGATARMFKNVMNRGR